MNKINDNKNKNAGSGWRRVLALSSQKINFANIGITLGGLQ